MTTQEILQGVHDWTNGKIVYDISVAHPDGQGKPTPYADLTAALGTGGANIPEGLRKGGMSVKFIKGSAQSSDNKYVQYRLASTTWSTDIHDWTSEDPYFIDKIMQEVNEAIDEHTPIEIHGDVTNAPDEEDLTSVNVGGTDVLKFKDKAYNQLTYSGMGRKILRKNIVDGVNTLTQEMMSDDNTIYIIQYDFTLGEDITVPANCILEFDGGSLSNGSLVLQNTLFDGVVKLGGNLEISGTCANQTAYQSWFEDNDIDAFIRFLNNAEPSDDTCIVNFESGTYYPTVRLAKETNKNYIIEGNFAKLVYSDSSIEEGVYQIDFKAHQHDNTRHIMQSVVEPGSEFIEFDSTEGINAGDFLTLMDLNTSSFSVVRNYQQGEIIRVAKVEGNKVYPDGGIFGIYKNLSNSMCYGIVTDFIKVTVKNLVIELDNDYPAEYDSHGINFRWCLLELDNIYSQRFRYNIELLNCLNSKISNCKVYSGINATGFDNYGITLSHCQNIEIDGGEYFGGSHGIAVGGGYGGEYNIVNRFINIHDVKAKSRKYKYGLDGHGNCEYFKVSRCNGDGIRIGGDYITINNNSVDTIELSGLIGANVEVVENLINKEFYLSLSDLSTYEHSYDYFTKHTINVLIGNNIFSKNATCSVLIRQHKSVNNNTINTGVIVVKGNITVNMSFSVQTELYDANDEITDEFDSTICIQDNISTEYNDGSANLKGKKVYYRNNISNTRQSFICEEAYIENNKILHAESDKDRFIFDSTIYTLKYVNIEKNSIESRFITFQLIESFDNDCVVFIKDNIVKAGRIISLSSVYPEKLYFINNILLGTGRLTNSTSNTKNVVATCGTYNRIDYNIGTPDSIVQAFTKLFDSNRNSYYKDVEDNYFYPMSNPSCSLLPTTGDTFDVKYSSGTGSYQTVMGLIFLRYVVGNDSTLGEPSSISTIAFKTEKGGLGPTKIKILGGNIEESLISIKIAKDGTNKDIYYNISITGYTLVNANMLVTNMYQGVSINPCFKTAVDTALNNPTWRDVTFIRNSGTFAQKPDAADICVGFKYFCTDKQTTEGATDGIEIIHKGNNVWVDALGRVVS